MEPREVLREQDSYVRPLLALGLAAVAIKWLRDGKRLRAVVAGVGAVALGYPKAKEIREDVPASDERPTDAELQCSICGDPISPGEARKPDENDETAHIACLEAPASSD